jgi:hypothetical protein
MKGMTVELALRMPGVKRLVLPRRACQGRVARHHRRCNGHASWRVPTLNGHADFCWAHLVGYLHKERENSPRLDAWLKAHLGKTIRVNMDSYNQTQADIEICILAFGKVEGSRDFFLPSGDMARDAFDELVDEAWNRLTVGQQESILTGRTSLRVPTMIEMP